MSAQHFAPRQHDSMPTPAQSSLQRETALRLCQLTVMFCDLVGSTALSEQLTPLHLFHVLQDYYRTCALAIEPFQGYIAQYLGDGVLAYFGYLTTDPDNACQAVQAGLEILAGIEQLNHRLREKRGINLAVRIGIHTGAVVVAKVGWGNKHEILALGETPNIAARLQSIAAENSVVLSANTHQIVQGDFECQYLGSHCLKGISHAMAVYQVQ